MNILLIGSGGREHALALALSRSPEPGSLYAAPANPGILTLAQHADIAVSQHDSVVKFCKTHHIDLVVIGPERLPKVARTLGHLLGRAQRYVNDVKSDINRAILQALQARQIEIPFPQRVVHSVDRR